MQPATFPQPKFDDYALLDSGDGEKLERFGAVVLRRPDPQALWSKRLPTQTWQDVDLEFERDACSGGKGGDWRVGRRRPGGESVASWEVAWGGARFVLRPTPFKHVGLFPEQAGNWEFVREARSKLGTDQPKLLNLFGYTGAASVLAVQAGYSVTHVDASKAMVKWVRENATLTGLAEDCMRVLVDDAAAFVRREARRGSRYNVVLLDPPHQGKGPKGEKWRFENGIAPLLSAVADVLEDSACVILSTYAIGFSPLSLSNLLGGLPGGESDVRELALPEDDRVGTPRQLPCGFCARWTRW